MINLLFEDDQLLIVDKPPGLTVDSSSTESKETLEEILKTDFKIKVERGGIVHRLDKNTSGILVVAKTTGALENLQLQFQNRTVKKTYLALVHGRLTEDKMVEAPIGRNPDHREKFIVIATGKEAKTEFSPLQELEMTEVKIEEIYPDFNKIQLKKLQSLNYPEFTLVSCRPLTGRTHQIRVHLKYLGFSIVGDEKYGGRKVVRLDKRWCPRQFLHAAKIEFTHPETGKLVSFESQLPEDLEMSLSILQKAGNK